MAQTLKRYEFQWHRHWNMFRMMKLNLRLMQVSGRLMRCAKSDSNRTNKLICFVVNVRSFLTRQYMLRLRFVPVWKWKYQNPNGDILLRARMCRRSFMFSMSFKNERLRSLHELEPIRCTCVTRTFDAVRSDKNTYCFFFCLLPSRFHSGHSCDRIFKNALFNQFSTQLHAFYKTKINKNKHKIAQTQKSFKHFSLN